MTGSFHTTKKPRASRPGADDSILDAGYPPLRILRFFTFEGAAVMDGRATEIDIPPPIIILFISHFQCYNKKKTGEVSIHAHYKTNDALLT